MLDDHISESEAEDLGARLEELCQELSPRQQTFLRAALRLAAAEVWARTNESLLESSIPDLIGDIQQAGAARAISRNPLPMPLNVKGTTT